MSAPEVCDVCGKPATVHLTQVEQKVGGRRVGDCSVTRAENYCAECAVAKGLAEAGFDRPEVTIPQMAEQFANIINAEKLKMLRDLRERANLPPRPWMEAVLKSDGYHTDFSPPSLWEIDRFFDDHCENGVVKEGAPFARNAEKFKHTLIVAGFYIGEVVRRHLGGQWFAPDDDTEESAFKSSVRLPDGTECFPVQRARDRFELGAQAGIAAWGLSLGLPVGPCLNPPPK